MDGIQLTKEGGALHGGIQLTKEGGALHGWNITNKRGRSFTWVEYN